MMQVMGYRKGFLVMYVGGLGSDGHGGGEGWIGGIRTRGWMV